VASLAILSASFFLQFGAVWPLQKLLSSELKDVGDITLGLVYCTICFG